MPHQLLNELNAGIKAMDLVVPEDVPQQLIEYIGLLNHWNKAFNLTAIRQVEDMIHKHLLDSLSVMPFIGEGTVLDVGSGAGLPGIPLALAKPDLSFVLVDCNGKKTRFMTQVKMVLKLDNIQIIHSRIEDYRPESDDRAITFDTVIARAYASTRDILASTSHLHSKVSRILIMQGKLEEKCDEPGFSLYKTHTLNVYKLNAQRHLIEIMRTR